MVKRFEYLKDCKISFKGFSNNCIIEHSKEVFVFKNFKNNEPENIIGMATSFLRKENSLIFDIVKLNKDKDSKIFNKIGYTGVVKNIDKDGKITDFKLISLSILP